MVRKAKRTWGGSLHQTFRLLPTSSRNLRVFLESDGRSPADVLARLPYDSARAGGSPTPAPDPKRYRDGKQVYQTAGLLYEGSDDRIRVTQLGRTVLRWLEILNSKNSVILARHAAYALSACQLRNPTGAGRGYDPSVEVFPFAFIWIAMLALDNRISSNELNRGIFKVTNREALDKAIAGISEARAVGGENYLGEETIDAKAKNDRIIPWMSLASFGWTIFPDKGDSEKPGYYTIPSGMRALLSEAARATRRHREFDSTADYIEHISRSAALPPDLR